MHKQAQLDMDAIGGAMRRGAGKVQDAGTGALSNIVRWWSGLSPDTKSALKRGLIGAGVGAATLGGISALTPKDPESRRGVAGPAMLGAVLGGGTAAGLPYGAKMLTGGLQLPRERQTSMLSRAGDTLARGGARNIGKTVGVGAGGYFASQQFPTSRRLGKGIEGLLRRVRAVKHGARLRWERSSSDHWIWCAPANVSR